MFQNHVSRKFDSILTVQLELRSSIVQQNGYMGLHTEPPLPGYYQYFWGVNAPCSSTQQGLTRVGLEPPTSGSGVQAVIWLMKMFVTIEPHGIFFYQISHTLTFKRLVTGIPYLIQIFQVRQYSQPCMHSMCLISNCLMHDPQVCNLIAA